MKVQGNEVVSIGANLFTYALSVLQTNEVFQIIELVCSVLLSITILGYRVWKWWKEAKKDGKIDSEEIEKLGDIVEDAKDEFDQHKEERK